MSVQIDRGVVQKNKRALFSSWRVKENQLNIEEQVMNFLAYIIALAQQSSLSLARFYETRPA